VIILDTNVISEFMGDEPAEPVRLWLREQSLGELYFTAISVGEIEFGLALLKPGRRKDRLRERFIEFREDVIAGRMLVYDKAAAVHFGQIFAARRRAGRATGIADAQIAAIARTHGLAVATRNTSDFEDIGLTLINPFEHVV